MPFRIIQKFSGINDDGLTFEQTIAIDVRRYIKALGEWYDNDGRTDLVRLAMWIDGMYEARLFMEIMHGLRAYFNEYLMQMLSDETAQKLKQEILDTVVKYNCKENLMAQPKSS